MGCAASVTTFSKVVPAPEPNEPKVDVDSAMDELKLEHCSSLCPCVAANAALPPSVSKLGVEGAPLEHEECDPPTSESYTTISSNVLFQISVKDHVNFDQEQLEVFCSWDASRDHAPPGRALPPGRPEHDRNGRHVRRFMRGVERYPRKFRQIVGREEELEG
ncbi:unnamed protein product [Durusdinium trenchii]|uniref:Uncharacterized protein n=1 Tax=Durusdinium trenchii TaxID=1381693 RepID=A0ABP0SA86_9DINO